jgi:hypothetical protein
VCASLQEGGHSWLWLPLLSCPWGSSVFVGSFPAGQRGRVRFEIGTSRVVGKQDERVRLREAKGRLSYERGGEELKGKNKSENRRERGRSLNLPFHLYN